MLTLTIRDQVSRSVTVDASTEFVETCAYATQHMLFQQVRVAGLAFSYMLALREKPVGELVAETWTPQLSLHARVVHERVKAFAAEARNALTRV